VYKPNLGYLFGDIIVYVILLLYAHIMTLYQLYCLGPTVLVSFILHLWHWATSRKVAVPMPVGVTETFDIILPAALWPWSLL
jgi:hypothetical protein